MGTAQVSIHDTITFWFMTPRYLHNFNPLYVPDLFLYPLKTAENLWFSASGFLMFSGGIERKQQHKMG